MNRIALTAVVVLGCALTQSRASGPQNAASQHTPPPQQGVGVISAGGPASAIRPVPDNFRFANGQTLHYSAEWRLWTAGTATIRLDQAANGDEHLTATADSAGAVAVLYRVADHFESLFNKKSFCSTGINKHSEEGLHRRETKIQFDYGRKKSVLDEKNLKTNESKHTEEDIPGCVTDVLSGIYYVGSMPLEPGSTYVFPLNDGGKTYDVTAVVEAREEIKTLAGTFRTVRVQPSGSGGVLKSRGKIWIWYSDDAVHIPVQMRARMFWGTLTFQLVRVDRQP